jgi:hypothetical protein
MDREPTPGLLEQGRTDSAASLHRRLATAPPPYVEGALGNPHLDDTAVELLLQNPGLTERLLTQVGHDERLLRRDEIKYAVARHPAAPLALSMHLVKFLHWRDLAELCRNTEMAAALRNLAEQMLSTRLNQIPSSERYKMARTGGRGILTALFRTRDPRLIPELLRNPRVAERDVATLVRDQTTPSTLLSVIARDEKWANRPTIRLSLVENRSTPLPEALRLVRNLPAINLRAIRQNPRLPAPLRAEAAKLIVDRQKGRRR